MVSGVLGTRTRGGRMEGADKSTELRRHPSNQICLSKGQPDSMSLDIHPCSVLKDQNIN